MKKKFIYIIVSVFIVFGIFWSISLFNDTKLDPPKSLLETIIEEPNSPPCLKTYYLIEKYSKRYNIPKHIAYSIAYQETNYKGPFDWDYNPFVSSSSGAHGAMQIMLSTANFVNDTVTKKSFLKKNLEYNIATSMKLLRNLHNQYKNWAKVCGCYNTGRPIINDYAKFCMKNKKYKKRWINYD